MKETINVSIGNRAFTIDIDAYELLKNYLDQVSCNMPNGDSESMFDIESRISEIIQERLPSQMMVVTTVIVRGVMKIMGTPSDFAVVANNDKSGSNNNNESKKEPKTVKKLYRLATDSIIGGVCSGLSKYFGLDVVPIRIALLALLLFFGITIPIYIILWAIIPLEPKNLKQ